ncbi:MAG: hypothetical protein ACP5U1_11340, partial [Desulfomonilaceae bacterium]
ILDLERTKGQNPKIASQVKRLSARFGLKTCDTSVQSEELFADLLWKYKTSCVPSEVTEKGIKRIGAKVFRYQDGAWEELTSEATLPEREINFLSPEYLELALNEPTLGTILALGPQVVFIYNNARVKVVNSVQGKKL